MKPETFFVLAMQVSSTVQDRDLAGKMAVPQRPLIADKVITLIHNTHAKGTWPVKTGSTTTMLTAVKSLPH